MIPGCVLCIIYLSGSKGSKHLQHGHFRHFRISLFDPTDRRAPRVSRLHIGRKYKDSFPMGSTAPPVRPPGDGCSGMERGWKCAGSGRRGSLRKRPGRGGPLRPEEGRCGGWMEGRVDRRSSAQEVRITVAGDGRPETLMVQQVERSANL